MRQQNQAPLIQIKATTLLIQGDRDPFYPVQLTVDMCNHINDAFLWVVPNKGHVPTDENAIQQLYDALKLINIK